MKNNKLWLEFLGGGLILLFIGFMAIKVVPQTLVSLTKAAPVSKVSVSNSYFIGNNILAKADGIDKCTVYVFVMDSSGKGIKGANVVLSGLPENKEEESLSGTDGKTVFEVSSIIEGQYTLTASIGGLPLSKTLKVTFRN